MLIPIIVASSPARQHILCWGGLRGALALVLAPGLPLELAQCETLITVAFGIIAFSILNQGLTLTVDPLVWGAPDLSATLFTRFQSD